MNKEELNRYRKFMKYFYLGNIAVWLGYLLFFIISVVFKSLLAFLLLYVAIGGGVFAGIAGIYGFYLFIKYRRKIFQ